jgi:hypothetical protein
MELNYRLEITHLSLFAEEFITKVSQRKKSNYFVTKKVVSTY